MPAMMIGPNSSGRIAAAIITCQPAWQLPITTGLPSLSLCISPTRSTKSVPATTTSSIVWPGSGQGRKPTK